MDTIVNNALCVHKDDSTMRRFVRTKCDVYCWNMRDKNKYVFNISTIEQQKEQYSAPDVERAKKAQKLQETMGFISDCDLLQVIDHNMIIGSKVCRREIMLAWELAFSLF